MHLSLGDIDSHTSSTVARINIKQSKIDPFCKSIQLFLGTTDNVICLVKAILSYLALRGNKFGTLFIIDNDIPLTRQPFSTSLSAILMATKLDLHKYNSHGFRIEAATSAKLTRVSGLDIKILKRWRSNTFERYIRTPREYL